MEAVVGLMASDPLSAVVQSKDIVERALSSLDRLSKLLHVAKLNPKYKEVVDDLISVDGFFHELHDELIKAESTIPKRRGKTRS